ncbi:MAG: hypothetical protein FWF41_06975 [Betaproteobacteria bacterium]|nr:hypothetical protein [Betaproteobacteria bacterium]
MKKIKQHLPASKRQRGVVLLITLVILVVMMLASVGIMRSVDTSVAAVGNMAFKQAADEAAGAAIQQFLQTVVSNWTVQLTDHPEFLDHDGAVGFGGGVGYYASIQPDESVEGIPALLQARPPASDAHLILSGPDGAGNRARIVIERMCNVPGAANEKICQGGKIPPSCKADEKDCSPEDEHGFMAYYRVSVRVDGPKNTVSFAQSFILL